MSALRWQICPINTLSAEMAENWLSFRFTLGYIKVSQPQMSFYEKRQGILDSCILFSCQSEHISHVKVDVEQGGMQAIAVSNTLSHPSCHNYTSVSGISFAELSLVKFWPKTLGPCWLQKSVLVDIKFVLSILLRS